MDQNYASVSQSMDPPELPQPTQRHSKNEWEAQRTLITRMYGTDKAKLSEIKEALEQDHNFVVNDRQLKEKIRLWNLEKNAKKNEMDYILRKQQQRLSNGKIVKFRIRKQPVPQSKIKRFEKQEASRSEMLDSPLPSTPSDISYSPASIRASSPQQRGTRYYPNVSSPSTMNRPMMMNHQQEYSHGSMDVVVTPDLLTDESLNVIMQLEAFPFEGQSPAPFTPIPSPAPSPRMVPASLRIQSSFDTDSRVPHQTHSSIQHLSPSEGSHAQTSGDMLLLESTNSLSWNINVSEKLQVPSAPKKTRYREEEELDLRRRLDQFRAIYGSNHPATLDTMSRLGRVLQDQGRFRSAEACFKTVAEQSRKLFGEDDLRTIEAFLDFAGALHNQSNLVPAEKVYRKLSTKIVTLVPTEHSLNLEINSQLGLCLRGLGRLQEAERILNEVIALGCRGGLQPDDNSLLRPMRYLAVLQIDRGDLVESERILLAILAAHGGDRYSRDADTLSIRASLGFTYLSQGRFQESESLLREVSADQARVLGAEHRQTLLTLRYLASVLSEHGKHAESEQLLQSVLKTTERTLGPKHIDTLQAQDSLVQGYIAQERFEEAEVSASQVLAIAKETLGEDHHIFYSILDRLGRAYEGQGRLQEALDMFRRAWEGFARMLGEDHRFTLDSRRGFMELQGRMILHPGGGGLQVRVESDIEFSSVTVV